MQVVQKQKNFLKKLEIWAMVAKKSYLVGVFFQFLINLLSRENMSEIHIKSMN
jgi:hypothetical protein